MEHKYAKERVVIALSSSGLLSSNQHNGLLTVNNAIKAYAQTKFAFQSVEKPKLVDDVEVGQRATEL